METTAPTTPAKSRPRWLRYSLRSLLLLMTLVCVWLGLQVNATRQQRDAVAAIRKAGGTVWYDYQMVPSKSGESDDFDRNASPPGPAWLRKFLGDDYFRKAITTSFQDRPISKSDFARIAELPGLTDVNVSVTKDSTNPSGIQLPIADSDLNVLQKLTQLRHLRMEGADIDGSGLGCLANLKHLGELILSHTQIDDTGLEQIGHLQTLEALCLYDTRITDDGLKHLQNLTDLKTLVLSKNQITDAGVPHLKGLAKLNRLFLLETQVTADGFNELQQALPTATISWQGVTGVR